MQKLPKTRTEFLLSQTGMATLILLFLLVAAASFEVGASSSPRIHRVSTLTETSVFGQEVTTTEVSSTVTINASIEHFATAGAVYPPTVQVSGKVSTSRVGASVTGLSFESTLSGRVHQAKLTNGNFIATLENGDSWKAVIHLTGISLPTCTAGVLALWQSPGTSVSASWSC